MVITIPSTLACYIRIYPLTWNKFPSMRIGVQLQMSNCTCNTGYVKQLVLGVSGMTECQPCATGTYSTPGATVCTTCPRDSYCPAFATQPIPCPARMMSLDGATACAMFAEYTMNLEGVAVGAKADSRNVDGFFAAGNAGNPVVGYPTLEILHSVCYGASIFGGAYTVFGFLNGSSFLYNPPRINSSMSFVYFEVTMIASTWGGYYRFGYDASGDKYIDDTTTEAGRGIFSGEFWKSILAQTRRWYWHLCSQFGASNDKKSGGRGLRHKQDDLVLQGAGCRAVCVDLASYSSKCERKFGLERQHRAEPRKMERLSGACRGRRHMHEQPQDWGLLSGVYDQFHLWLLSVQCHTMCSWDVHQHAVHQHDG